MIPNEAKQGETHLKRLKKYTCWGILTSSRFRKKNLVYSSIICLWVLEAFLLTALLLEIGNGGLLANILFLVPSCAIGCYLTAINEFKSEEPEPKNCSKEEAQALVNQFDNLRLKYNQNIICKDWSGKCGQAQIVLTDREEVEYQDWINLSQKVEIENVSDAPQITLYIENDARAADRMSNMHFEDVEKAFVDPRKHRGTYYKYERFFENNKIPEVMVICKKNERRRPVLPWYYNDCLGDICICLGLGAFWHAFRETILSKSYVYYNHKSISPTTIDDEWKQRIEQLREENKLTI